MRSAISLFLIFLLTGVLSVPALSESVHYGEMTFDPSSESIDLKDTKITDFASFYDFLEQFPHLKRVDMFATPVSRLKIQDMEARFPDVEFGWTIQFAEHTFRTDVTAYSTLHMSNAKKHGNADISLVRYCRNLKALDIGHNSVTDLSFLYDLPDLRVLIIACNDVTDITPIGSLKHLEYLEVFTNNIRDISALSGLDHLMDLNISYNYIGDITPLFSLKSLKRLWSCRSINRGMNMSLSPSQINDLKAAFPDLELNNASNPTGGTWREHPHFDVIHSMFRTGVYVPFEDSFLVDEEAPEMTVTVIPQPERTEEPESQTPQAEEAGADTVPESSEAPVPQPLSSPEPGPSPSPRKIEVRVLPGKKYRVGGPDS